MLLTDHFIRWWDFGADAYIVRFVCLFSLTPNLITSARIKNTNKYIRLTRNTPSQMVPPSVSHIYIISFKSHRDGYGLVSGSQLRILLSKSNLK